MRVVQSRTGVVLDPAGGALAKMLPPFRLGVGGPVAGGPPVRLLDPRRRPRRHDARGARATSAGAARSTRPRPAGQQPRLLARARARAAAPGASAGARARAAPALRRDGRDRHRPARASCPPSRWCSATSSPHPQTRPGAALGARRLAQRIRAARARDQTALAPVPLRRARVTALAPARGAVLGLDDHAAGPLAEQVGGRRPDPAARRRARGSSTSRSPPSPRVRLPRPAPRRGCACGSGPVWILMPARRAWMRALSSTERPCASSSSRPASSDSWLGHGQHVDRIDDAVVADQLRGGAQRRRADVVAEDRHERRRVLELLEVGRALGARRSGSPCADPGPGACGRRSSRPCRAPSRGCRRRGPRCAAPSPRPRRRPCRCRRSPPSSGSPRRGCARSRASGRAARGRDP